MYRWRSLKKGFTSKLQGCFLLKGKNNMFVSLELISSLTRLCEPANILLKEQRYKKINSSVWKSKKNDQFGPERNVFLEIILADAYKWYHFISGHKLLYNTCKECRDLFVKVKLRINRHKNMVNAKEWSGRQTNLRKNFLKCWRPRWTIFFLNSNGNVTYEDFDAKTRIASRMFCYTLEKTNLPHITYIFHRKLR